MNGVQGSRAFVCMHTHAEEASSCNGFTSTTNGTTSSEAGGSRKNSEPAWIRLNVGGQIFQTTRTTLCRESGFLSRLILENDNLTSDTDESGAYLIDRDPEYFAPVLNYLRHGKLVVNPGVSLEGVLHEADFYALPKLSLLVAQEIRQRQMQNSQRKTVYRVLQCHGEELTNMISALSDGWRLDQVCSASFETPRAQSKLSKLVPLASTLYQTDVQREFLCVVSQECADAGEEKANSQDRAKVLQERARNN